jgi:hypothetical protein
VRLKKGHEETKQEWSELIGESAEISQEVVHFEGHDYSQHARAVWELLTEIDDDEFKKTWQSGKESVYKTLSQAGKTDLEPLERVSLTMVKFGLAVFQLLSSQVDADPDITDEDIEKAMEYVMRESGQQERTSHVEEFLQLAESAARAGEIDEGVHYSVVSSRGADNDELCLRLPDVHGEVSRYLRERDINADFFDSHKDYRERLRELSDKGRLVTETSKVHRDLNRCVAFDLEQLDEELSDFEADMFTSS